MFLFHYLKKNSGENDAHFFFFCMTLSLRLVAATQAATRTTGQSSYSPSPSRSPSCSSSYGKTCTIAPKVTLLLLLRMWELYSLQKPTYFLPFHNVLTSTFDNGQNIMQKFFDKKLPLILDTPFFWRSSENCWS